MSPLIGYLAPDGFLPDLLAELSAPEADRHDRLVLVPGPERAVAWTANIWRTVERIPIASIGDGAKKLRAIQRNWALYSTGHHRRAALIAERLPKVSAKPLVFGAPVPAAPLGSWTLIAPDTILAAAACSSPFPHGEARFVEDKTGPPNRAYLKLWEALTLIGRMPGPGETCIDLGASPGGWTWVLQGLGARVIAVDKAPLDPRIATLPGVEIRQDSAFALDPRTMPRLDWLFCDVICYPERLLGLIERWQKAGKVRNYVCTIKFQGASDGAVQARFAAMTGSRLMHLHHNKHELTWVCLDQEQGAS